MDEAPTLRLGAGALTVSLRPYDAKDEEAAIALWLRSWQTAYPKIDFSKRLEWWRDRWRNEIIRSADIVVAKAGDEMIGFVTVDPQTCYLDQIVVAPEHWASGVGSALIAVAKELSPARLELHVNADNARAIRFYEKLGFSITGDGVNPISGKPVHRMRWAP